MLIIIALASQSSYGSLWAFDVLSAVTFCLCEDSICNSVVIGGTGLKPGVLDLNLSLNN